MPSALSWLFPHMQSAADGTWASVLGSVLGSDIATGIGVVGGREGSGGNHGIWRQQRDLAGTTTSDGGGPGLTVKQQQLSTATYNSRDTSPVTFDAVLYCNITYAVLLNLRRILYKDGFSKKKL